MNPARTFNNVDFPAPEGPMIAVNSPALKSPLTPCRISFVSEKNKIKIIIFKTTYPIIYIYFQISNFNDNLISYKLYNSRIMIR